MGDSLAWPSSERPSDTVPCQAGPTRIVDANLFCELVDQHHRFIWRLLRQLGVAEPDVDDTTQQVFMVLAQRKGLELTLGSERSFLFGVALKVARTYKRARRREAPGPLPELCDLDSSPEALTEQRRARRLLDEILDGMPLDLRVPFVLFELDDLPSAEIAELLGVPRGTVASRLRRAREWFERRSKQLQTAGAGRRESP